VAALNHTLIATPTADPLPRRAADFNLLGEALAYAAQGQRGMNFHDARGDLKTVLPYSKLYADAQATARRMLHAGLKPGDRVALVAETSAEFVTLFLGATLTGILPTPLPQPTSFGGKEAFVQQIRTQLLSCDPMMLVGPDGLLVHLKLASQGLPVKSTLSWSEFSALPDDPIELITPQPNDVCYLQYSSGSTRFPHGIMVTHASLMNNCHIQGKYGAQIVDTDRCISWLPFYHDLGLVGCFLTTLCFQVSSDYIATDDFARRPLTWLKMISKNPGTSASYSPTFGFEITSRRIGPEALKELDLSRWRLAGIGGDMIRPDVMQRFIDSFASAGFKPTAFVPSYGLAECTLGVTFISLYEGIRTDLVEERALKGLPPSDNPNEPKRYRPIVNCGKPLPGYDVQVRNANGDNVGERQIGKFYVRGKSVMLGYFRDEASTSACLSADGWLDTGDMAYLSDGNVYIVGRAKDMIIINGKNHWPQDIEWAVEQLPGFRNGDIAAFATTADSGEEVPTVLVQCRVSDLDERATLKAEVTTRVRQITGMNCLVELVPPRSLPRTSSGKLSRTKARTLYLSGELSPVELHPVEVAA
jgi:fatty-acyl-CoA synthase